MTAALHRMQLVVQGALVWLVTLALVWVAAHWWARPAVVEKTVHAASPSL